MAKYLVKTKLLIAHLSKVVDEGEVIDTNFPEGFFPGDALELIVEEEVKPDKKAKTQ